MNLLENYYKNDSREIEVAVSEAETLQIATNPRLSRNRELVWSFEIAAEVNDKLFLVENQFGFAKLCDCRECLKFDGELNEFYSIYMALDSIRGRFSNLEHHLWFYSEKFKSDFDNCIFSYYKDIYRCGFLALLGDRLSALIGGNLNPRFIEVDEDVPF